MNDNNYNPSIIRMGIPDEFVEHGSVEELRKMIGMDKDTIKSTILEELSK